MFTEYMTPPLTMKIDLEKGHKAVEIHSILASFFALETFPFWLVKLIPKRSDFRKLISKY